MSKKELDRLGDRLRDAAVPSEEDLALWARVRPYFLDALQQVRGALEAKVGPPVTSREKNRETLVDKLRREQDMRLSRVQDVVGARLVRHVTLAGQDQLVAAIGGLFPDHRVRDRRRESSHGYRAVHVVVRHDGIPVEIQVRTRLQDAWAEAMEHLGDVWGRPIRYGGDPVEPDRIEHLRLPGTAPRTRRSWMKVLIAFEVDLARVEEGGGAEDAKVLLEPEGLRVPVATLLSAFERFEP